ncbi:MAG: DUF4124 domain-containing protein [Pseudomonadales bacterium]|nr:DUF4124 domain-containing protein [Pseudomonadales bacterium]
MRILALLLITISIGSPAHAEIFRWVDKDGNVQFSDAPPPRQRDALTDGTKPAGGLPAAASDTLVPAGESLEPGPRDPRLPSGEPSTPDAMR